MKINRKQGVITMSAKETKVWQSRGPDAYRLKELIHRLATDMMAATKLSIIEVYASMSDGGWMADQLEKTITE